MISSWCWTMWAVKDSSARSSRGEQRARRRSPGRPGRRRAASPARRPGSAGPAEPPPAPDVERRERSDRRGGRPAASPRPRPPGRAGRPARSRRHPAASRVRPPARRGAGRGTRARRGPPSRGSRAPFRRPSLGGPPGTSPGARRPGSASPPAPPVQQHREAEPVLPDEGLDLRSCSLKFTPTTVSPRGPSSRASVSSAGISSRHGAHQVAQKFSSTTGREDRGAGPAGPAGRGARGPSAAIGSAGRLTGNAPAARRERRGPSRPRPRRRRRAASRRPTARAAGCESSGAGAAGHARMIDPPRVSDNDAGGAALEMVGSAEAWQPIGTPGRGRARLRGPGGSCPLPCCALGAALRLWQYGAGASLWADEANMALNIVERPLGRLLGPLDYRQVAPPGWLLLQRARRPRSSERASTRFVWSRSSGASRRCRSAGTSPGACFRRASARRSPSDSSRRGSPSSSMRRRRSHTRRTWPWRSCSSCWLSRCARTARDRGGASPGPRRRRLAVALLPRDPRRRGSPHGAGRGGVPGARSRPPAARWSPALAWAASALGAVLWARGTVTPDDALYMQRFWAHDFMPLPPRESPGSRLAGRAPDHRLRGRRPPVPGAGALPGPGGAWRLGALAARPSRRGWLLLMPIAGRVRRGGAPRLSVRAAGGALPLPGLSPARGGGARGARHGSPGREGWRAATLVAARDAPRSPCSVSSESAALRARAARAGAPRRCGRPGSRATGPTSTTAGRRRSSTTRGGSASRPRTTSSAAAPGRTRVSTCASSTRSVGAPRAWLVVTHAVPEETTAIRGYLDRIGTRRASFEAGNAPGTRRSDRARVDLYDLSDAGRLATVTRRRSPCRPRRGGLAAAWSCHPGAYRAGGRTRSPPGRYQIRIELRTIASRSRGPTARGALARRRGCRRVPSTNAAASPPCSRRPRGRWGCRRPA